jgi:hypothetical protein
MQSNICDFLTSISKFFFLQQKNPIILKFNYVVSKLQLGLI